jgi:predicted RND superfamily exporter protein
VLAGFMWFRMHIFTNFFDLYPPNHPYIKLYTQYRSMFGTANTLLLVLEVKDGTIFDSPEAIQKVERITLAALHDIPGVNGEQVLSITHPKLKTTLTAGSGIKVVPLMYPRVPETKEDLEFLKLKVYTTEGVKGRSSRRTTRRRSSSPASGRSTSTCPPCGRRSRRSSSRSRTPTRRST